jgi:protein farnesyltransferase subunit beta
MYRFLVSLKQPDGSFTVHRQGEIDVRATYCVCCISLILGIATPELFQGVGEAVGRCQTYEGGLSAASQAFGQDGEGATLGEAHGGYAYCALASHLSLSLIPSPQSSNTAPFDDLGPQEAAIKRTSKWTQQASASSSRLDVDSALRWAVSQQGIAIEGGGFRGRTNKLVDGCYGWFSGGGMFSILGALQELRRGQWWKEEESQGNGHTSNGNGNSSSPKEEWESIEEDSLLNLASDGVLFDRVALQEYILLIAQAPKGGLRDKPNKNADAYHTCYNLSGLSMCQHRVELDSLSRRELYSQFNSNTIERGEFQRCCYAAMLGWTVDSKLQCVLGGPRNQVAVTHPIFNIGFIKAKTMMDWAYNQL